MVELVYKFNEKYYHKVRFKFFWHTNIPISKPVYIYIIYMDTNTDHIIPLAMHVRGKKTDEGFAYGCKKIGDKTLFE